MKYGIPSEPFSLDPAETGDYICSQIAFNILETLVRYDWSSGDYFPVLAESWEHSPDHLEWTFHLRPSVTFHDGSSINAASVKNSFERQINKFSPYYCENVLPIYRDLAFNMIEYIEIIDNLTVRFHLKFPSFFFLDNIACPFFSSIVSTSALSKYGNNFGTHPIGTGPFKFKSWINGTQIVLEKFENYWNTPPGINQIQYKIVPILQNRMTLLKNGELDIITGLSAAHASELFYQSHIKLITPPVSATVFLGFNCMRKPFDDIRLRKAVLYAIDRKKAITSISRGFADVAQNVLPPLIAEYDPLIKQADYNLEKAIQFVNEAGCFDNLKIKLGYIVETDTMRAEPFSQYLINQLEKIGIQTEIVQYSDWSTYYQEVIIERKVDMLFDGWITYTKNADNLFQILFQSKSSYNFFNYSNPVVDMLLEQASRCLDESKRRELYSKVHQIIIDDTPAVFLSHPTMGYGVGERVNNFKPDPCLIVNLASVILSN